MAKKQHMMNKRYTTAEFAALIGRSSATLHRWDKKGILKANRTMSNLRFYTEEHLKIVKEKEGGL